MATEAHAEQPTATATATEIGNQVATFVGSNGAYYATQFQRLAEGSYMEVPAELQEASNPYLLEWVRLRQDSGGAGKYRGGLGVEKCYRIVNPVDLTVIMERTKCAPWGLDGGGDGGTGRVEVHRNGGRELEIIHKGTAMLAAAIASLCFRPAAADLDHPAYGRPSRSRKI